MHERRKQRIALWKLWAILTDEGKSNGKFTAKNYCPIEYSNNLFSLLASKKNLNENGPQVFPERRGKIEQNVEIVIISLMLFSGALYMLTN